MDGRMEGRRRMADTGSSRGDKGRQIGEQGKVG